MTDDPFKQTQADRKDFLVPEGTKERLDAFIAREMGDGVSRTRVKALINAGAVSIDGKPATEPSRKVKGGEAISLIMPEAEDAEPEGEDIPLEILHEDGDIIVINKQAGLVVHPGAGNWTGTLVNALIHHCGDTLSGIGGVKRPGIVHRLDKDTTGVMVVAKNDAAHQSLAAQFADHGRTGPLQRAYKALIWGRPKMLHGTIDAPLGRAPDRIRRAVKRADSADADFAITHYTVERRFGEKPDGSALASLVECRLETGRTHQIRVHMAHIGHPLIGDNMYGGGFKTKVNLLEEPAASLVRGFPRQALHAALLVIEHPSTGEEMRFEAPLPADMAALCAAFEG
ncbi:RluA family pseudouridine synthase [Martelella mediterranea]|uniref:Pseudouridine synthase n=1 Tax=Martelella mediterranea DSM 17316 TaxID=1122214 RepID=A0A1U9YZC8_9HYPH|nr:RluA family pseudouridine synthase [Martelella mediterranea]AQZ50797.1 Ribosomal large subunit pseudouridine synthase D [Martelella mediterranea DSM 17316]